jgi:hypothetical protein
MPAAQQQHQQDKTKTAQKPNNAKAIQKRQAYKAADKTRLENKPYH